MTGLAIAAVCLLTLIWMTLAGIAATLKEIRDTQTADAVRWNFTDPRRTDML